jgi:hypothetical protein
MNLRSKITTASGLLALVLVAGPPAANAAGVIVGTASTFGSNADPFGMSENTASNPWGPEYQQVYSSSAFSGSIDIRSLSFYNTQFDSHHYAPDSGTFDIYLSTTSAPVNGLSTTLANNTGSNETLVYSGPLPTDTQQSLGGQFNFLLANDFSYNPTAGNLLLTVTSSNATNANPVFLDGVQAGNGVISRAYGPTATADYNGLVTGFDTAPVPLPAALPLLLSALGGVGALARRRKSARA